MREHFNLVTNFFVAVKVSNSMTGHPYPLDYVNRIVSCNITEGRYCLITVKHEIPGQCVVIPGSLDRPSKLVKSLDCPGQPWTVGNYVVSYLAAIH